MRRLKAEIFHLNPSELDINSRYIFDLMGYGGKQPGKEISNIVRDIQESAPDKMNIQAGFTERVTVDAASAEDAFYIDGSRFDCGKIISGHLAGCESLIFFCTTLGISFDEWSQSFFQTGDAVCGLAADSLGSVMVEAAAEWLDKKVQHLMSEQNLSCTSRFSPGYCGWDVSEQQKLFKYLPVNFLNIQLTESSLMLPIKSISGIIGIGKDVKRVEYACQLCSKTDCYMRRTSEEVI